MDLKINKKPNENDIPSDGFDNNDNNNNIYLRRSKNRNGRINVENYVVPEPCHRCPGENGAGVFLNSEESKGIEEVYKKEFFNLRASDKISLWRSIPDSRFPE